MTLLLALLLNIDTLHWPLRPESKKLETLINNYRLESKVHLLPNCDTLNMVSSMHVAHIMAFDNCNLWSWNQGPWWTSYGCVEDTSSPIMNNKPYELSRMKSKGYEIVHMHAEEDHECTPECAFKSFKNFPLFREMMLESRWKKMGVTVFRRAASVWFIPK